MGDRDNLIQDAEGIKTGLASLRSNVKSLESQHKQALFALTPDQQNSIIINTQNNHSHYNVRASINIECVVD
jgi:hypothetical protein